MRIACVDNISAAAYRLVRPNFSTVWLDGSPVRTVHAMATGQCDAALVSVAALPYLAHLVQPAGPYGIASSGRVRSVIFAGRCTPKELVARNDSVYLPPESFTARAMFPLLCRIAYGRAPRMALQPQDVSASVLIGNEALCRSQAPSSGDVIVDLGEWWQRETGLSFVFAQWMLRRTLSPRKRHVVQRWLEGAVRAAETAEGRYAMEREVVDLGLSRDVATSYYQGIQFRLDQDHQLGMAAFLSMQEDSLQCTASG